MAKMTAHSIEYSQWVLVIVCVCVCVSYTYLYARLYANNCHLVTACECYNNYFVQHFNQTIVPSQVTKPTDFSAYYKWFMKTSRNAASGKHWMNPFSNEHSAHTLNLFVSATQSET